MKKIKISIDKDDFICYTIQAVARNAQNMAE